MYNVDLPQWCELLCSVNFLCQQSGGYVIVLSVILQTGKMTNAETDVDQTCQTWASGDPLEVVNFWW